MNELIKSLPENKEYLFDKFVFFICIIDCLFLPYLWLVSIPYTMPLIFYWFFKKYKLLRNNDQYKLEYKLFFALFILMGLSTVFSVILAPQYAYKNVVFLILYTSMFLYYFMFLYYINKYPFVIKNFLIVFILFVVILAAFFNIDKNLFQKVVLFWNPRSEINANIAEDFVNYRYTFIWMDANNIGYMMNAIVLYLWCNEKTSFFIKIFSLLSLLFVLIACMSNGAFLSSGISIGLYLIVKLFDLFKGNHNKKYKITPINIVLFLIALFALYKIIPQIPNYLETGIAMESLERISNNSGDSRFVIWQTVIQSVNFFEFILIGKGGVTLVNGLKFAPHNGHFYWILGYGFISYFIFMYLVFRKRKVTSIKKYIWITPILIGYTVNVLLGEIKMMSIIMLLIACSSSVKYLMGSETSGK
ncbi:hypothetical protein [[Clostridium] fimetarium]|uniref:O-Antigen ligase n=1 Tax=[Clostridium] fimetarium TaxID=99656 RepID=A0A1I0RGJ1_9FIRM|nr:hypothetical protein [[Clostridium] fimetarium]SEW39786.1 hypothetical protein SAMN05421659_11552 [[Clostridium] fimetarium]